MSLTPSQRDRLATATPFDGFEEAELHMVGDMAEMRDLPSGAILMREGESGEEMAIILEGRALIERGGAVIAERGPGEVIGEMTLLSERPRTATVRLGEDARLLVLGRTAFDALMADLPAFRGYVLGSLARRARDL